MRKEKTEVLLQRKRYYRPNLRKLFCCLLEKRKNSLQSFIQRDSASWKNGLIRTSPSSTRRSVKTGTWGATTPGTQFMLGATQLENSVAETDLGVLVDT